jgi:hypothetical protein
VARGRVATRRTSHHRRGVAPRRPLVSAVVAVVMANKKHSTKSAVRARMGYVAPLTAIRRGEILEEIVDHLRPWKRRLRDADVIHSVNVSVDILVRLVPRNAEIDDLRTRAHAEQLDTALSKIEALLASAPNVLRDHLVPSVTFRTAKMQAVRELRQRWDSLVDEIKRLHEVCAAVIDPKSRVHQNYDHAKHESAKFALDLMGKLSDRKITGTADGAFRAITSLLYEAISGQEGADLKRACDAELRKIRDI